MDLLTRVMKWTSEGKVWRADETTLRASVTAVPTTTAGISIWNGEPNIGGKAYVFLVVYGIQGGTPAALNSWGIVHQVSDLAAGTTQPTADLASSTIVVGMGGNKGIYKGAAVFDVDLSVVDDRWAPIGYSTNTSIISLTGTQIYVPLMVPVIVPPGAVYSLEATAAAIDVLTRLGWIWAEVEQEELDGLE